MFFREHLWLPDTKMLYGLMRSGRKEKVPRPHAGSSRALTRLFALQSAKQISRSLENQVDQTCQRFVVQFVALEDHPRCDKRQETIP